MPEVAMSYLPITGTVALGDLLIKSMLYKRMIHIADDHGQTGEAWQVEELPEPTNCMTCSDRPAHYRVVMVELTGKHNPSAWYDDCAACIAQSMLECDIVVAMRESVVA